MYLSEKKVKPLDGYRLEPTFENNEVKPFDYTKWRRDNLCIGMTVEETSKDAMAIYKQENI